MLNGRWGSGRVGDDRGGVVDAAVAGAQGETPGARRALHDREPAAPEATTQLVGVAQKARADAMPGGAEQGFQVVHGGNCTEFVRYEGRRR